MHAGTDELEGVHVACRNDGLDVRTRREFAHNGPDDIVGLEARVLVDGNAERLEYLGCDLQLGDEFVLGLDTRGLIRLEKFVAMGSARQIARRYDVIRLERLDYLEKHEHEPVEGTRGLAF